MRKPWTKNKIFDTVDEQVDDTKICIKKIIHNCSSIKDTSKDELFTNIRKLCSERKYEFCQSRHRTLTGKGDEIYLIRQYEDEISEMKRELSHIYDSLLQLKLDESHDLCVLHSTLKGEMFGSSLRLKELNHKITVTASKAVESGVRLPKLKTPWKSVKLESVLGAI